MFIRDTDVSLFDAAQKPKSRWSNGVFESDSHCLCHKRAIPFASMRANMGFFATADLTVKEALDWLDHYLGPIR